MVKKVVRARLRKRNVWKDAFIPHKGNGRHPHLLRANVIVGVIALVIFIEAALLVQAFYLSATETMTASVLPAVVADLTNQERADGGLKALAVNPLLQQAAQDKADDMAAKGYFSHVAPDGTLPWHWFEQAGYNYEFAGENLAINFTDSNDVVNAWMQSPMHRANILKQDYTEVGIGIAQGLYQGQETTFVVEFFATPEPAANVAEAPTPAVPVAAAKLPTTEQNLTTVEPTTPVETAAQTPIPANATAGTPQILGVQTESPQSVSPWMRVAASPKTYATYLLLALAALFLSLLLVSYVPKTFKFSQHLPHPAVLMNSAALLAVVFGILLINQNVLSGLNVTVPDAQNAAVARAIR